MHQSTKVLKQYPITLEKMTKISVFFL